MDETVIEKAAELTMQTVKAIDDVRGSANYRKNVVRNYTAQALRSLRDREERSSWPERRAMLWGADGPKPSRLSGIALHHDGGVEAIEMTVNERKVTVRGANGKTLLDALRDDVGLTGTKEGCAEGE